MNTSDLEWRTSRRSGGHSACVQIAVAAGQAAAGQAAAGQAAAGQAGGEGACRLLLVRDSKDTAGPVLAITPAGWMTFSRRVKQGQSGTV